LQAGQIGVNSYYKGYYGNKSARGARKNKANSKPNERLEYTKKCSLQQKQEKPACLKQCWQVLRKSLPIQNFFDFRIVPEYFFLSEMFIMGIVVTLENEIKSFASSQGADLVGIAGVEVYFDYLAEVRKRIKETGAQLEDYMIPPGDTSFFERLSDPRETLPDARAIIMLGVGAYDKNAVYANLRQQLRGKIARTYSSYPVVRQIAEKVADYIEERGYKAIVGQNVPLKFVADRIGLGAYGKNGLLLTQQYGSYVGFRNIITDMPLAPDRFEKMTPPCDDCQACLKACPTGALYSPYKVNPRLCINPLTRKQEYIEPALRSKMQNWICGCDICQEVCPVNRKLVVSDVDPRSGYDSRHHASHKYLDNIERTPLLTEILGEAYPDVIRRNASIALANTGKGRAEALEALKKSLANTEGELKHYHLWAISILEGKDKELR
jgi:epoxyqueuosine reductase